jgi:integrase
VDNAILSTVLYTNFIESIKAEATKKQYKFCLEKYIQAIGGTNSLLRQNETKLIEAQIINYVVNLKKQRYSGSYISCHLAAIFHFYTMNDIILNKKKISMFIGTKVKKYKDKGYTWQQIATVLDYCDLRTKLIVLIFASSGIRLSALPPLELRHIHKIKIKDDINHVYRFTIYEGTSEEYVALCTPECARILDSYLSYRERSGEKLNPNGPLIREQFDKHDIFKIRNPKHLSTSTLGQILDTKLRQAGVREITHTTEMSERSKNRKEVPRAHGFRKFFDTALVNACIHPTFKKLLMGHSVQLDSEISQAKLLEEYYKAVNALTISEENSLKTKVEELTSKSESIEHIIRHRLQEKEDKLTIMEERFNSMQSQIESLMTALGNMDQPTKNSFAKQLFKRGMYEKNI